MEQNVFAQVLVVLAVTVPADGYDDDDDDGSCDYDLNLKQLC